MTTTIKFQKASVATFDGKEYLMLPLPEYEDKIRARKFAAEAPDKPYVAEIKRYRRKRSLDANAYFWVLTGKLAAVVGISKSEAYREYVRNIGDNFDVYKVLDDAKDRLMQVWESRGEGWICDDLGASEFEGWSNVICYRGSSTYDTRQMSCLIDLVIFDCKEQGIETLPPDQLTRLKESWNAHEQKN